jgi:uncharacterized protein YkwD
MIRPRPALLGRLLLATTFAAVFAAGLTPLAHPQLALASTSTAPTVETQILGWINNARASKGLAPLRVDSRLRDLAEYRASVMSAKNTLSHTVAGVLSSQLTARGIQWYSEGECIAWDSYAFPTTAAQTIWQMWHDASHWPLLMSNRFNYVGLGVVHNTSNNKTWASLVLTESVDHSRPWAQNVSHSRSGSSVSWSWKGADTWLQTHTSGLKNFDIEYRVDSGTWSVISAGTGAHSLTLSSRAGGHYYGLRIRSRDNRGYVSNWTAEVRIWVP